MPYRDPERQQAYMKAWRDAHRTELHSYMRAEVLRSAVAKQRFPLARTIRRYNFTSDELMQIVRAIPTPIPDTAAE